MSRGTMFWGSILVIIGFAILLDNLGLLGEINIWGVIWPLLLIAVGAWIIWGNYFHKAPEKEHVTIPIEDAQSVHIHLQHGAGRLSISAGTASGNLLEGDFGGGLDVKKSRQGDGLKIKMNTPSQFIPFSWYPGYSLDWNVTFSKDLSLSLELETGASDSRIDLSELRVSEVRLKSGASSTRLTLPAEAGFTRVGIESGAASIDIQIPEGVAARVRSRGGLSSITLDRSRFPRTGDVYESADYELAKNKAEIDIQMGVGSVSVR